MMPDVKKEPATKKTPTTTAQSLYAIWKILRDHATPQKPLGAADICDYMKKLADRPADSTVKRLFPKEKELMEQLFPGAAAEAGAYTAVESYIDEQTLHIVLETPGGEVLKRDGMALEASLSPVGVPSPEAVDSLLRAGIPVGLDTFPYKLKCVMKQRTGEGRIRLVPYEEDAGKPRDDRQRLYYLTSALTENERAILAERIATDPLITATQAKKFMRVIDRLHPAPKGRQMPERYAFRQNRQPLFATLQTIDRAIAEKKKLMLVYGEYTLRRGDDGIWKAVLAPRRTNSLLEFEPYALLWANGGYILVGKNRDVMNLRVDRIVEAKQLNTGFEVPEDFDAALYRGSCPTFYSGEPTLVRMRCKLSVIGELVDTFGNAPEYGVPNADGATVDVTLAASAEGVREFALCHIGSVEVIKPADLRAELLQELQKAVSRYAGR